MKMKLLGITLVVILLLMGITIGQKYEAEGDNSLQTKDCIDEDCSNRSLLDKSVVIESEESFFLAIDEEDEFGTFTIGAPMVDKKSWWQFWQSSDSKREDIKREMNREKDN